MNSRSSALPNMMAMATELSAPGKRAQLWAAFLPTVLILYLILNWLPTLVAAKGFDRSVAPQSALAFNTATNVVQYMAAFAAVAGVAVVVISFFPRAQ